MPLRTFLLCLLVLLAGCPQREPSAPRVSSPSGPPPDPFPGNAAATAPEPATTGALSSSPPLCDKSECGPAPMYPSEQCADGRHLGGRGPCARLEDGSCHWLRLACPAASGSCDCGIAPAASRWSCPDGEDTGELGPCVRDRNGTCGWLYHPCAPHAASPPPAPAPGPRVRSSCEPLPSDSVLRSWEVGSVCAPGGGPAPPPLRIVLDLGDGTFIFQGPYACFRARYRKCFSK